jgi:hypothetical protein
MRCRTCGGRRGGAGARRRLCLVSGEETAGGRCGGSFVVRGTTRSTTAPLGRGSSLRLTPTETTDESRPTQVVERTVLTMCGKIVKGSLHLRFRVRLFFFAGGGKGSLNATAPHRGHIRPRSPLRPSTHPPPVLREIHRPLPARS